MHHGILLWGFDAECVCKCAGSSPWDNFVRGCLECAQKAGVPPGETHNACYAVADSKYGTIAGLLARLDIGINCGYCNPTVMKGCKESGAFLLDDLRRKVIQEAQMVLKGAIGHDLPVVLAFDGSLVALTAVYLHLASRLGMGGIYVALAYVLMCIICTIVAGWLIRRVTIGVVGTIAFWLIAGLYDVSTSGAGFRDNLVAVLGLCAIQVGILVLVWWFTHLR